MSKSKFKSKYQQIVIDKVENSANDTLAKKLTVEEYYDLMHHTHDLSSLVGDDGETTISDLIENVKKLVKNVTELEEVVKIQKITIEKYEEKIVELTKITNNNTETVNNLTEVVNTQNKTIQNITNEVIHNGISVGDWDVEKPGDQDINGDDLGKFLGLDMTEI